VPAFPPKAVAGAAPQTEGQAARTHLHWLRTQLDAAGRAEQELLALGDGSFDALLVQAAQALLGLGGARHEFILSGAQAICLVLQPRQVGAPRS
jgi:hypothetical protein